MIPDERDEDCEPGPGYFDVINDDFDSEGDTDDNLVEVLERLAIVEEKQDQTLALLKQLAAFGDRVAQTAERLKDNPMLASLLGTKK